MSSTCVFQYYCVICTFDTKFYCIICTPWLQWIPQFVVGRSTRPTLNTGCWWLRESGGDLSDDVVGSGSPFARTDDAEGCGDISLLCSSIWNIKRFNIIITQYIIKPPGVHFDMAYLHLPDIEKCNIVQ